MEKIIKMITDYGMSVVFLGIFGYLIIKVINFGMQVWKDNHSAKIKKTLHDKGMDLRIKITPEIKNKLRELLLKTHSGRAFIFEFHNGVHNMGGIPFVYMSNTYEVLGDTASSQIHARQQMPFTIYDSLINQLIKDETVLLGNKHCLDCFEGIIHETNKKFGTTLMVASKLTDENGRVIGWLGIDYLNNDEDSVFKAEALSEIRKIVYRDAQVLGTLLCVKVTKEDVILNNKHKEV